MTEHLHIRSSKSSSTGPGDDQPARMSRRPPEPVDWFELFNRDQPSEDWAIPSLLPAGRQATIWAQHKTGKSLLTLDICAAAATGRPVLGQAPIPALKVVYLDMEMTEDDLEERITDLGYEAQQLGSLHYYLLPSLPPLNTPSGGDELMNIVDRHDAQLVVIDTLSRVVSGKENDADTVQAFYDCTGIRLKQRGVSALRLDHAGKDPGQGVRGSSAKGDDVDLAWELTGSGNDFLLKQSYSRISWVPQRMRLRRHTDPLRHVIIEDSWPAGTETCASHLDRLNIPKDATVKDATQALRAADITPRRKETVAAAQRWRRQPNPLREGREPRCDATGARLEEPGHAATGTTP